MKYQTQLNLARRCIMQGKYEYAAATLERLKDISPYDAELLLEIGKMYINMHQFKKALENVQASFDAEKSYETLELLADLNRKNENLEDAAVQYETLLEYKKEPIIYNKCIDVYSDMEFEEEAIRIAKMYLKEIGDVDSYSRLIFLYIVVGMTKEAKSYFKKMEKKYPNDAKTYNIKGFIYECLDNDYPKAKEEYKKAAKRGLLDGYYQLGVCCKHSEEFEESEKYLKKLISLNADSKMDYNYTLGSIYFAQRKLRLGYKYYKKRSNAIETKNYLKNHLWNGKDYPNNILYIFTEQGFGDNIQFIRYIPKLLQNFKKVYLETRDPQMELFQRSYPKEQYPNLELVPVGTSIQVNHFAFIMDLPYLMHESFHNIPAQDSYLTCSERGQEMFRKNFFNNNDLKIGLNWKAKGMGIRDAVYRTIDAPYYFKDIIDLPNTKYYSFQMNDIFDMCKKYPQIKDLAPMFNTFHDTACALKNLDIFITVDTALAHLAGALGIKTYLLLCFAPDWRWFDNDDKTEWYPSVKIIKQHDRRTWKDVAEKLTEYIKKDVEDFNKIS